MSVLEPVESEGIALVVALEVQLAVPVEHIAVAAQPVEPVGMQVVQEPAAVAPTVEAVALSLVVPTVESVVALAHPIVAVVLAEPAVAPDFQLFCYGTPERHSGSSQPCLVVIGHCARSG